MAYYIATINIEETFHDLIGAEEYTQFEGIVLTDTFAMTEKQKIKETEGDGQFIEMFAENSERANKQLKSPITVIIGNPPYSVGQRSANDNNQNTSYPFLDTAIAKTYVYRSNAALSASVYDTYIKAFRWATDRLGDNGVIGFVSNGAWLDGVALDGFRECLIEEFNHIYVFNLRGNQRTSGELSRKEGGKIFGSGSRTPVAITILVKRKGVKKDGYAFSVDPYYEQVITKSMEFLVKSGGSPIPPHMEKVVIYYTDPIFRKKDSVKIKSTSAEQQYADLKQIGFGSYATVYSFFDKFYNRTFVLKRANSDLSSKEIERFKQEYEQMTRLSSPYIVEVYRYDGEKNEYIMEHMDFTLKEYIEKQKPAIEERKNIIYQIFRAFKFIHSKNVLHRDISPANVMIKVYDDVNVVKICDFGLVKLPDSDLTSVDTILKGCYNDPALITEGFKNYTILHETYALTRLVAFILTGKATADRITDAKLKAFVEKGLSSDKEKRFKSVAEMETAFRTI